MNFMNRKLFKARPARDKLNKMGGIMSSSQPLMQTVQKFKDGMSVRASNNPAFFGNFQTIPRQFGLGPQGQARALMAQVPSAQANREKLQQFDQQTIINPLMQLLSGRKAFDTTQVQVPTMQNQEALKQKLEGQGYDLSQDTQLSPQPSTLSTDPVGRPKTPSETLSDDLSRVTIPGDMTTDTELVAPGTREAEEEGMGEGVLSGFTVISGEEQPKTKSGKPKPAPAPVAVTESGLSANAEEIKKTTEQLASFLGDPSVSETEKNDSILEQFGYKSPEEEIKGLKERAKINAQLYRDIAGVSPEEDKKIDGYNLAMMGFMIAAGDSPDALQNIAEGMAKGTSMMMDTKKARQERDRQFKIAGLDKAIKDDDKRKQLAIDAYNKRQDRRFSLLTDQFKGQMQQQTVLLQLSSREKMLGAELAVKQRMAQADNISAERRTQLQADVDVLEAQMRALPEISAMVVSEIGIDNALSGGFDEGLNSFLNDPEKLAQAQRISQIGGSKTSKTGPLAYEPERYAQNLMLDKSWVERNQYAAIETLQAQGIEEPTQNQIEAELKNRAAREASTPITGGAAAPGAATTAGFTVGQEVVDGNGNRARVTSVDSSGNVTGVAPIQ